MTMPKLENLSDTLIKSVKEQDTGQQILLEALVAFLAIKI